MATAAGRASRGIQHGRCCACARPGAAAHNELGQRLCCLLIVVCCLSCVVVVFGASFSGTGALSFCKSSRDQRPWWVFRKKKAAFSSTQNSTNEKHGHDQIFVVTTSQNRSDEKRLFIFSQKCWDNQHCERHLWRDKKKFRIFPEHRCEQAKP